MNPLIFNEWFLKLSVLGGAQSVYVRPREIDAIIQTEAGTSLIVNGAKLSTSESAEEIIAAIVASERSGRWADTMKQRSTEGGTPHV